jgi:hypothetical protein
VAVEIADGNPEKFLASKDEFVETHESVARAIRAEMGLDEIG